jgi:hypothetical protein
MKTIRLAAASAALIVSTFVGSAQISDNFDSYTTKAQFDAVWTPSVGGGLDLYTAQFVSSPNSVKNPLAAPAAAQSRQLLTPAAPGQQMSLEFDFYDSAAASNVRDYCMLYSRVGTDWTGALNQILAIGKYNSLNYYARVAFESTTYTLGDGATAVGGGWIDLHVANSIGWHSAGIVGMWDPVNSGKTKVEFYIDNTLVGSVANLTRYDYNWAVLGSGITSTGGGVPFDNIVVTIPEPSTFALSLLGGLGMMWIVRRRKA